MGYESPSWGWNAYNNPLYDLLTKVEESNPYLYCTRIAEKSPNSILKGPIGMLRDTQEFSLPKMRTQFLNSRHRGPPDDDARVRVALFCGVWGSCRLQT